MTSTFTELPLSIIRPSPRFDEDEAGYQRRINDARVRLMADRWSDELYAPIDVVRAEAHDDGTTHEAVNGNHRLEALRTRADRADDDPMITVHLHNGGAYTTPAERAALFRRSNSRDGRQRTTVPLTAREDYLAGVRAEDPECLDIAAVVARHDLEVTGTAKIRGVAVTALQTLHRYPTHGGRWLLDETLTVLTGAWPEPSAERHLSNLILGLGVFIRQAKTQRRYKRKGTIAKLDEWDPTTIILQVRGRQATMTGRSQSTVLWASVFRDIVDPQLDVPGWRG